MTTTNIAFYDISRLAIEFIPDEDPTSSFLRIKLFTSKSEHYSATLVLFPNNPTIADRFHDIFLAARSPEPLK